MSFTDYDVQKVWEKGQIVPGNDPNVWRKDECGAWIGRTQYGNRNSQYGWEIDHITPEAHGGGDELSNLRPLQWANNANKQDGRLTCPITASDTQNARVR
jgi:5-methylcytosine-specific restriction endonuclease McrA